MKPVAKVDAAPEGKALVNIVRPRVFMGDGVNYRVWDGTTYLGTLKAGRIVQYAAEPGEHVFLVDSTQGGKWGRAVFQVEPGQVYYLKPNQIPFVGLQLGVAEESDERIQIWNESLKPVALDQEKSEPVPQKYIDQAKRQMQEATFSN